MTPVTHDPLDSLLAAVIGALVAMAVFVLLIVFFPGDHPDVPEPPPSTFGSTVSIEPLCDQLPERC
jgi:hypothetical protein